MEKTEKCPAVAIINAIFKNIFIAFAILVVLSCAFFVVASIGAGISVDCIKTFGISNCINEQGQREISIFGFNK